jgi:hypothetical protein
MMMNGEVVGGKLDGRHRMNTVLEASQEWSISREVIRAEHLQRGGIQVCSER